MSDLVFRIRNYFLGGLSFIFRLPRTFGRNCLAAFLWGHIGPMGSF